MSNFYGFYKRIVKELGYDGCRNCKHQIEPLRGCEWLEKGGDGRLHIICPGIFDARIQPITGNDQGTGSGDRGPKRADFLEFFPFWDITIPFSCDMSKIELSSKDSITINNEPEKSGIVTARDSTGCDSRCGQPTHILSGR